MAKAESAMRPETEIHDIIDEETGEVLATQATQLARIAGLRSKKDLMALVAKGANAKPEDFEERERDFWKPGQEGEPDTMRGVYVGSSSIGEGTTKRRQHAFVGESKRHPGEPLVWRMNGSAALNSQLANVAPGDYVEVRFTGKEGTVDGYKAKMFDVRKLRT